MKLYNRWSHSGENPVKNFEVVFLLFQVFHIQNLTSPSFSNRFLWFNFQYEAEASGYNS